MLLLLPVAVTGNSSDTRYRCRNRVIAPAVEPSVSVDRSSVQLALVVTDVADTRARVPPVTANAIGYTGESASRSGLYHLRLLKGLANSAADCGGYGCYH